VLPLRFPTSVHAVSQSYIDILTLGRGGMGEVKLAVAQGASGFKRLQVVKRLRPELTENAEFVAMFLQEARLAARLSHPNIVQTNEVGHDGTSYYIAMEYLEGRTLSSILRRSRRTKTDSSTATDGPSSLASSAAPISVAAPGGADITLPLPMHLRVIADTLEGLHFAHELCDDARNPLHLVHRDVSPVNIFVTYDGVIKVLDFGIAKAADADVHTRTGVIKGKVAYMAPEQFFSKQIDRRCDVYAVGVMLWEAATGERLWHGLSDMEIVKRLGAKAIPSPVSVNPAVHPRLNEIVLKAMALKADQRYPTAAALQEDIEELLVELGGASSRAVGLFFAEVFASDRLKIKQATEKKLRELAHGAPSGPISTPRSSTSLERSPSHPHLSGVGSSLVSGLSAEDATPPSTPSISIRQGGPQRSSVARTSSQPDHFASRSAHITQDSAYALAPPPPQRSRILAPLLASTAAAIIVAAVTVAYVELRPGPTAPVAPPPTESTPPPPVKKTQLAVQATPADAQIYLDDAMLPANPYVSEFPMDNNAHRIRVEAHGFIPQTHLVSFNQPTQALKVTLVKIK
jgi:serine/threonine-protein kinase